MWLNLGNVNAIVAIFIELSHITMDFKLLDSWLWTYSTLTTTGL